MDWGEGEVHEYATKVLCQYPAILTEQVWEEKDLSYGVKNIIFLLERGHSEWVSSYPLR